MMAVKWMVMDVLVVNKTGKQLKEKKCMKCNVFFYLIKCVTSV